MNWYKTSSLHQIEKLKELSEYIKYISQLVFYTGRGAQNMLQEIIDNKKLSSFEDVLVLLNKAMKEYRDNPRKFSLLCVKAATKLDNHILDSGKKKTNKGLKKI